jgi:8-hydroxy-5-deazaflavin:NADPH oxidoreductase
VPRTIYIGGMKIGILGSGLMGSKLGTIFARAGHRVVFSYSRDPEKLEKLAKKAGANARPGTPAEAVSGADAVLLAVHWSRVGDVLAKAGSLAGKTVVSCSLPMSKDDDHLVVGHKTSGAETLARKIPKALVVSAFSTAPSEVMFAVFARRRHKTRPNLVFCGNDKAAKKKTAALIRAVGFEPVDLGELSNARFVEPYALLLAGIAYEGRSGPALGYRFEHFTERRS